MDFLGLVFSPQGVVDALASAVFVGTAIGVGLFAFSLARVRS